MASWDLGTSTWESATPTTHNRDVAAQELSRVIRNYSGSDPFSAMALVAAQLVQVLGLSPLHSMSVWQWPLQSGLRPVAANGVVCANSKYQNTASCALLSLHF